MLKKNSSKRLTAAGTRFAIVASQYNARYVNGMVRGAEDALRRAGAQVLIHRVPGAFEIPIAARWVIAADPTLDAVLCLGLIWQGETAHADHIGVAVTDALMRLAMETGVPVIHEVLQMATRQQATARCLDPKTNKGVEAATTAIQMARLLKKVQLQP